MLRIRSPYVTRIAEAWVPERTSLAEKLMVVKSGFPSVRSQRSTLAVPSNWMYFDSAACDAVYQAGHERRGRQCTAGLQGDRIGLRDHLEYGEGDFGRSGGD